MEILIDADREEMLVAAISHDGDPHRIYPS